MEILTFVKDGFAALASFNVIIAMVIGVILGTIFGALPGLSATTGMALLLPIAYKMDVMVALGMLGGIYAGALYGGSISAILLGIPGTAAALPTTFDGFPMSRKGRPTEALLAGLYGSSIGGVFSALVLMFLTPVIGAIAIRFGAPEMFALGVWGISMVSGVVGGDVVKGLFMAVLGLLVGMVGADSVYGFARFTFGSIYLYGGIKLVPVILGFLAMPKVLEMVEELKSGKQFFMPAQEKKYFLRFGEVIRYGVTIIRSAVVGCIIGIAPAAGPGIASMLCYNLAKKGAKDPDSFGEGNVEGVWASETANNAATGGSLVFALSLGIPGSAAAAVLMSALVMRGIQPGPMLLNSNHTLVYGFFAAFLIVNVLVFLFGHGFVQFGSQVLKVPVQYLCPAIIVICVIGAFSDSSMFGMWCMLFLCLAGYLLVKMKFPVAPFMLSLILVSMIERNFWSAYSMTRGNLLLVFTRPMFLIILFVVIATFAAGPIKKAIGKKKNGKQDKETT